MHCLRVGPHVLVVAHTMLYHLSWCVLLYCPTLFYFWNKILVFSPILCLLVQVTTFKAWVVETSMISHLGTRTSASIEGAANVGPSSQPGIAVPDFLPPAQRVLFMRLQQKQQEDEERARRLAEGGGIERENEGTNEKHCFCLQHLIQCHLTYFLQNQNP